jgi:hypothetical protein
MTATDCEKSNDIVVGARTERDDKRQGPGSSLWSNSAGATVVVIEALSKLAWPAVVCWAILMFAGPVNNVLTATAGQIPNEGATWDVAGLKISLTKNSIPVPPYRVKAVLPGLDAEELDFILQNVGDSVLENCYVTKDPDDFKADSSYLRMQQLNLISFSKADVIDDSTKKKCTAGSTVAFTPLYALTRSFLIGILKRVDFSR